MAKASLPRGGSRTIQVITPALPDSKAGNRTTAHRWAELLGALGHDVGIDTEWDGTPCDAMVALHAWRSRASIAAFRSQHPKRLLIVALTGTDVYDYLERDPEPTRASMAMADALVGLHDRLAQALPEEFRPKLHVIHQSAPTVGRKPASSDVFDVLVIAHLRDVKDPLRAAMAVRRLPETSQIRVTLLGDALDETWERRARTEASENPRFRWLGGVDAPTVQDHLARARVLVVSSRAEGGANVVSEAIAAGTPIVASEIDGNLGLLGRQWPATFPVGDEEALRTWLLRLESDRSTLAELERSVRALAPRFTLEHERQTWQALLDQLGTGSKGHELGSP
ncbi:MAG: selenoneine biosynthesis selenosugar synthase SenB [Myxococcota bacterium]